MAEKLCTLRTKGGGGATQTETVLWTNSSPSSSFTGQNITLLETITNYDYIKVTWKNQTTTSSASSLLVSVSDFKAYGGTPNYEMFPALSGNINATYARYITYVSDTTVGVGSCSRINNNTTNNAYLIPLSIIGIKNMGGIRTNEKYESQTWLSVAGNAIPTFSTQGMAKAIWVVRYVSSMAKAVTYSNVNPYTGEIDDSNTYYYDSSTPSVVGTTSAIKFIVTNGQITTSASFSNAAHLLQLSYTY